MRMSCKDCLHRDGCCNFVPIEGTIEEKAEYLYECLKKPCKDFKNKNDFVEVVRCRDCKNWVRIGNDPIFNCDFGTCKNPYDYTEKETYGKDYCSNGERKGGEAE